MRLIHSFAILRSAFLLLCLASLCLAQTPKPAPAAPPPPTPEPVVPEGVVQDQANTIRVNTDYVSIEVAVTDRVGNDLERRLRAEDFVIYEDGVPQRISSFSATETAFNVALLLDTSGSTRSELDLIRQAALRFLGELRTQDRAAVVQFNQEVELIKDLTADRQQLEKALGDLRGGSGTAFYDAVQLTLDEVFRDVVGRKAIIALTDGVDSIGTTTYAKLLPLLERSQVALYFLELNTENYTGERMMRPCGEIGGFHFSRKQLKKYFDEFVRDGIAALYQEHCVLGKMERGQINQRLYQAARRELREMTDKTGGRLFPVESLERLAPAYSQIAADLHRQYSLAYYPTNERHDGRWRKLQVKLKPAGLLARTRAGYRAPLGDTR